MTWCPRDKMVAVYQVNYLARWAHRLHMLSVAPAHQIEIHNEIMRHFTFGAVDTRTMLLSRSEKGETECRRIDGIVIAFIVTIYKSTFCQIHLNRRCQMETYKTTSIALTRNKMWWNIMQFRMSRVKLYVRTHICLFLSIFIVRWNETHQETFFGRWTMKNFNNTESWKRSWQWCYPIWRWRSDRDRIRYDVRHSVMFLCVPNFIHCFARQCHER